jgi:hypothetical protein
MRRVDKSINVGRLMRKKEKSDIINFGNEKSDIATEATDVKMIMKYCDLLFPFFFSFGTGN